MKRTDSEIGKIVLAYIRRIMLLTRKSRYKLDKIPFVFVSKGGGGVSRVEKPGTLLSAKKKIDCMFAWVFGVCPLEAHAYCISVPLARFLVGAAFRPNEYKISPYPYYNRSLCFFID